MLSAIISAAINNVMRFLIFFSPPSITFLAYGKCRDRRGKSASARWPLLLWANF
jgi:hypothetical protein